MKQKNPEFAKELFLFDKTDTGLKPVKKIDLNENQKKELVEKAYIIMRVKLLVFMLKPGKDELMNNPLHLYKPVIDIVNDKIIILGIYKVNENEESTKPTIH